MTIWATNLGEGRRRASLARRRLARAAKDEANAKFRAIGSSRRVGSFKTLKRYGDSILAVYEMVGRDE